MLISMLTSREFNKQVGLAKRAAKNGPVFITDRGRASHVFLSIDDYRNMAGTEMTVLEALSQNDVPDFDFDPPRTTDFP